MKRTLNIVILSLVIVSCIFFSCQSNQNKTKQNEKAIEEQKENTWNAEEQELIVLVEKLLFAVGNSDFQTLDSIISDKANLGSAIVRDGVSKNSVITISEYFEAQWDFFEPQRLESMGLSRGEAYRDSGRKVIEASKKIREQIPQLIIEVEDDFRKLLGADK